MATIQDVARRSGVSVTTVSNALNGRVQRMSKETLARIEEAIGALSYRPSKAARQLKTGQAAILGLLVPSIANPMFAALAREVEIVAKRQYGHRIFLGNTYRQEEEEIVFLDDLLAHGVRGVIVVSSQLDQSHFEQAIARGLTIINYDRRSLENNADRVRADNVSLNNHAAGHLAACCLIDAGCRRIAFATPAGKTISRRDKRDGCLAAADAAGIAATVVEGRARSAYGDSELTELGIELARKIAAIDDRPDGVVAINDMLAIGLIAGFRKCGIRVPDDISLVGIDDMILSALVSPAITSVRAPVEEMAQCVVSRLMARLEDASLPAEDFLFTPTLIERETVVERRGPPAADKGTPARSAGSSPRLSPG